MLLGAHRELLRAKVLSLWAPRHLRSGPGQRPWQCCVHSHSQGARDLSAGRVLELTQDRASAASAGPITASSIPEGDHDGAAGGFSQPIMKFDSVLC